MTQHAYTQTRSSNEVYPMEPGRGEPGRVEVEPDRVSPSLANLSCPGGSSRLTSQFRHEVTDEHPSLHLITLRILMGLSVFAAIVSFAAYIIH